jgi:hypothetical protein
MKRKSKIQQGEELKNIGGYYLHVLKRGLAFVFSVMTFPVFLFIKGSVFLYRYLRR